MVIQGQTLNTATAKQPDLHLLSMMHVLYPLERWIVLLEELTTYLKDLLSGFNFPREKILVQCRNDNANCYAI